MLVFKDEELDEVFERPSIREVSFEVRFTPRFRVSAELWKLQDRLVDKYPSVSIESAFQLPGNPLPVPVNVLQNPTTGRVIKITQENLVIAFTRYSRFEDFKDEVRERTFEFCDIFGVKSFTRVGLRYVNNIVIPGSDAASVLKYVRPFLDFDRVPLDMTDQFLSEVHLRLKAHLATLRSVLLAPLENGRRAYVLDIDCHSIGAEAVGRLDSILDEYHDSAQRFFLDHITEELKNIMRGKV